MEVDLRLQLLEPDRYPYLYKCLYGLLMLLPQSSAFAALKNRLNSVSAIGLLHTPASFPSGPRGSVASGMPSAANMPSLGSQGSISGGGVGVPGRLNRSTRDVGTGGTAGAGVGGGGDVKWPELLDQFRKTQEKARRRNERLLRGQNGEPQDDGPFDSGGGAARRSLLELHVDTQSAQGHGHGHGRVSRGQLGSLDERGQLSAGLRGTNRPGSGLGKPLPMRPDSRSSGHFGRSSVDSTRPGVNELGEGGRSGVGPTGSGGAGVGTGSGDGKGQKSRHSLAGNLGKFASGIGRTSSRDKERKEREREGRR